MIFFLNMHNIKATLFFILSSLLLCACSGGGSSSPKTSHTAPPALTSISINGYDNNLKVGDNKQLSAIATYSDLSTEDITLAVLWSSSDSNTATISQTGELNSLSSGIILVTAELGEIESSIQAQMINLVDLSISPASLTLAKNSSQLFTATGRYSDNSTEDLSTLVSWNSNNTGIADISDSGLLTTIKAGTSDISAIIGELSSTVTTTVTPAELKFISISNPRSLASGVSETLSAIGTYSDGTTQDISNQVLWTSSTPTIANVNENNGDFEAIQEGTVLITASSNGVSASTQITVSAATLTKIVASPSLVSLAKGSASLVNVIAIFSDGSFLDVSEQVNWENNEQNTITLMTDDLKVLGKNIGSATLTASLSDFETTISVNVSNAELTSLNISQANNSLPKGLSQQFSAIGTYSDGSTQDLSTQVTWISSSEVVSVIENTADFKGLAHGIGEGSTTISAILNDVSDSSNLTVSSALLESVEIIHPNRPIANGFSFPVKANGTYSDGSQQDITNIVEWTSNSSSNSLVLDISNSKEGSITTLAEGESLISANLGEITGLSLVNVSAAILQSINFAPHSESIPNGHHKQLSAIGTFSDNTTTDITSQVTWQSEDTSILSISNTVSPGKLSALKIGQTSISANLSGIEASTQLTITNATLNSITTSLVQSNINEKTTTQAKAIASYSDNSTRDITQEAHWISSNPEIASIKNSTTNKGQVEGISTGTSSLTASLNGISSTPLQLEVDQDPNTPIAVNLSLFPNAILNNSIDSSLVHASVTPASLIGVIPDTSQILFTIIEGDSTRTETVNTTNGVASLSITSDYDGLIEISASLARENTSELISRSASILSTTDFTKLISTFGNSNILHDDSKLLKGSFFAFYMKNQSSRDFEVNKIVVFEGLNEEDIKQMPDSPITDDIYLSEGTLSAAEFSAFGYILDNNASNDNLSIVYYFKDVASGSEFYKGLTYRF